MTLYTYNWLRRLKRSPLILIITLTLTLTCLIIILTSSYNFNETFTMPSEEWVGNTKSVHVAFARPVFPHLSFPLRNHVRIRIANVPLAPFKSPLLSLPPLKETLPEYVFYDPTTLSPIRDQGDCGACWVFAVCDTLSDKLALKTKGKFKHNLSVQQLLQCFDTKGCEGGSPEDLAVYLEKNNTAIQLEQDYPFKQFQGGQTSSECPKMITKQPIVRIKPGSVRTITEFIEEDKPDKDVLKNNISRMKQTLITQGPFYCAMSVYDDFFTFSGVNVYEKQKGASLVGGHAIEIIGYSEKGVDKRKGFTDAHWICRNSWGVDWPTQSNHPGYFAIRMGVNMCGVESRCETATPILEEFD